MGLALVAQRLVVTVDQREAMIRELPMIALGALFPGMPRTFPLTPPLEQMRIAQRPHSPQLWTSMSKQCCEEGSGPKPSQKLQQA